MIIGAVLVIVGIAIGYSIPFWKVPTFTSQLQTKINKIVKLNQAKIVDLSEIDLGENGN